MDAAAGDGESPRTITGIAVPWDKSATVLSGEKVKFMRGAFDVNAKPAKLIENHDMTQLRGTVTELVDSAEGLLFTATFAKTRAANDAIELVKAGAYDAVSVGAIPTKVTHEGDTTIVHKATLAELSLVPYGAFEDARITEIAASIPEEAPESTPQEDSPKEEQPVENPINETIEASAQIVPTLPIYAEPRREFKLPTAAEYIAKVLAGGSEADQFLANIRAAAPDVTTGDNVGILPVNILTPVYNNFRGLRPVIDAVGPRSMPQGGKVFIRPEVTTHTSIGGPQTENATITAGTMVVTSNQVTKQIFGGYVNVSELDIDATDPAVIGILLDDMARVYANQTDSYAATNLVSGATVTRVLTAANLTNPAKWVEWIYGAASTILSSSNGNLPNTLFLAPDQWGTLGQLTDTSGRPLFPQVGPMNAFGTVTPGAYDATAFGLRVVVDRNLAAGTIIVGDSSGFECFEQQKGAISLDQPSTLSRTIAFRGYFATLMIDETKFVKRVAA